MARPFLGSGPHFFSRPTVAPTTWQDQNEGDDALRAAASLFATEALTIIHTQETTPIAQQALRTSVRLLDVLHDRQEHRERLPQLERQLRESNDRIAKISARIESSTASLRKRQAEKQQAPLVSGWKRKVRVPGTNIMVEIEDDLTPPKKKAKKAGRR